MVDFGPVITPPGQYTHCVDRGDYKEPPGVLEASIPEIVEFLLCEYLLGGKLVCLAGGGDECAIGIVAGLEPVGKGRSGFEAIDNDFSFNVLLAPFQVDDFASYPSGPAGPGNISDPHRVYDDVVAKGPLSWLLKDAAGQAPLPAPIDQTGAPGPPFKSPEKKKAGAKTWTPRYPLDGYGVLWKKKSGDGLSDQGLLGNNLHALWDDPGEGEDDNRPTIGEYVPLPVMHCECEGSRIFFVCKALSPFLDIVQGKVPGGGPSPGEVCHSIADSLPWPLDKVGNAICSLVQDLITMPILLAMGPAMTAALATAWETAQAFDDLFVTGPVARQIHVGDLVIVKGRWVWDGGHSGATELHPVKSIQKLMLPPQPDPTKPMLPPELRPPSDGTSKIDYRPRTGSIPPAVAAEITATHERWCRLVREAPPPPDPRTAGGLSGPQIASLTPEQLAVWAAQNQPENSWTLHPLVDGCAREPEQPQEHIR
jgi:hypothetical protein